MKQVIYGGTMALVIRGTGAIRSKLVRALGIGRNQDLLFPIMKV